MREKSTFTELDWDFNYVWDITSEINDGMPFLRPPGPVSTCEPSLPNIIFNLYQNFPNPFNPYTSIQFSVGAELATAHVMLEIFNIRGQRVRTLINEVKPSGLHKVVWDGRDDSGRSLGSGVYFYRMRSGDFAQTRRMVLLK
jgi:hypothetical protein